MHLLVSLGHHRIYLLKKERQALADFLKGEQKVEAQGMVMRGLTQEERHEFIRIYNS